MSQKLGTRLVMFSLVEFTQFWRSTQILYHLITAVTHRPKTTLQLSPCPVWWRFLRTKTTVKNFFSECCLHRKTLPKQATPHGGINQTSIRQMKPLEMLFFPSFFNRLNGNYISVLGNNMKHGILSAFPAGNTIDTLGIHETWNKTTSPLPNVHCLWIRRHTLHHSLPTWWQQGPAIRGDF